MTSYKITVIVILATSLASDACQRLSPNYCGEVPDHNCLDRPGASPPDALIDASPDVSNSCDNNAECSSMTPKTPTCGTDHRCRACTTNTECDADACLPDGTCASETDVAYVVEYQAMGADCTRKSPCQDLQDVLDNKKSPYIRISGVLSTSNTITISRSVTILGDTGSGLTLVVNSGNSHSAPTALKINLDNANNDPTDVHNKQQVVINNFRIKEESPDGKDSIHILGMNPIVKLIHVSIDGGSGDGISTSDDGPPSLSATNPNIILTDVTVRQKAKSGVHIIGGRLTLIQSSVFDNTIGIESVDSIGSLIDDSSISHNNRYGISITRGDAGHGKFTISHSLIWNNGDDGVHCDDVMPGYVMLSSNAVNGNPQTFGCM